LNIDSALTGDLQEGALILAPEDRVRAILRNGPAEVAGLQEGDIITALNGVKISQGLTLAEILATQDIGVTLDLEYFRDGVSTELTITLADYNQLIY